MTIIFILGQNCFFIEFYEAVIFRSAVNFLIFFFFFNISKTNSVGFYDIHVFSDVTIFICLLSCNWNKLVKYLQPKCHVYGKYLVAIHTRCFVLVQLAAGTFQLHTNYRSAWNSSLFILHFEFRSNHFIIKFHFISRSIYFIDVKIGD